MWPFSPLNSFARQSPWCLALMLLLVSCGPSHNEPREGDLIDSYAWQSVPLAEDPFARWATEESTCDERGVKFEEGVLEIDTGLCDYYSGRQPITMSIREGDTLTWLIYHSALASTEPGLGYVALQVGDTLVFEREVPIPFSSQVYGGRIDVDFEAPAGTPAYFHVHNHGANSWRMAHLRLNEAP